MTILYACWNNKGYGWLFINLGWMISAEMVMVTCQFIITDIIVDF